MSSGISCPKCNSYDVSLGKKESNFKCECMSCGKKFDPKDEITEAPRGLDNIDGKTKVLVEG